MLPWSLLPVTTMRRHAGRGRAPQDLVNVVGKAGVRQVGADVDQGMGHGNCNRFDAGGI